MNYLRGVGYDLSGKDVDDLTARETFELLSAREIKSRDHIVDVLSNLTDRLATDKAEQAQRKNTTRKRHGTATLSPPRPEPSDQVSQAETEAPDMGRGLKPGAWKQLGFVPPIEARRSEDRIKTFAIGVLPRTAWIDVMRVDVFLF